MNQVYEEAPGGFFLTGESFTNPVCTYPVVGYTILGNTLTSEGLPAGHPNVLVPLT